MIPSPPAPTAASADSATAHAAADAKDGNLDYLMPPIETRKRKWWERGENEKEGHSALAKLKQAAAVLALQRPPPRVYTRVPGLSTRLECDQEESKKEDKPTDESNEPSKGLGSGDEGEDGDKNGKGSAGLDPKLEAYVEAALPRCVHQLCAAMVARQRKQIQRTSA